MKINELNKQDLYAALQKCCGAENWVQQMLQDAPFKDEVHLLSCAEKVWFEQCMEKDWREAFTHHPKIGDIESLAKKFASTQQWAGNEQAGVNTANQETLVALAQANQDYEDKFGYIFIICATGKTADEMLRALQERLHHSPEKELPIAMGEQHKITCIRLEKLLKEL